MVAGSIVRPRLEHDVARAPLRIPGARCGRRCPPAPGSPRGGRRRRARVFSTGWTAVAPAGTGAPVITCTACPGGSGRSGYWPARIWPATSSTTGASADVGGAHRVAVHRRAVEGRHVGVRAHVLGEHAAQRVRQRRPPPRPGAGVWARTISRASSTGTAWPPRSLYAAAPGARIGTCTASRAAAPLRGGSRAPRPASALDCDRAIGRSGGAVDACDVRTGATWEDDAVVMIDQRRLPAEEVYLRCRDHREVAAAIKDMAIRGAPAIGVAAALGIALGVRRSTSEGEALRRGVRRRSARTCASRGPPRSTSSGPSSGCAAPSTPGRRRAARRCAMRCWPRPAPSTPRTSRPAAAWATSAPR